jgi:hypothetical protein
VTKDARVWVDPRSRLSTSMTSLQATMHVLDHRPSLTSAIDPTSMNKNVFSDKKNIGDY